YISSLVNKMGEILEAKNGKEALEIYIKYKPDIIIMDVNMPIMDGLEALSQMKKINPNIKAIIVTAYPSHKDRIDGAFFITKPFEEQELLTLIRRAISHDEN
ncbi:MAG: response regulator, partial [Candidatus Methanomethyliaceae archaeon]|nr:response regulator [Candidatus Methanomethyliaceae archaeon]MDW7971490.1 response regulator [Nitrososphaerota archaeon]